MPHFIKLKYIVNSELNNFLHLRTESMKMKMGEEAGIGRVEFVWIQIQKVNQTRH